MYKARIEKTISLEFEFTEDDIEDDDSPQTAAEELAESFPESMWNLEDEWCVVTEELYAEAN